MTAGSGGRGAGASGRADPALLAHIEGYPDRAERLLPRAGEPEIQLRAGATPLTRFRLGAWRLRLSGEPREVERPPQIADDLQHRTPQAILRDLHRPVRHVPPIRLRPAVTGPDPARAPSLAREAMQTRYTVHMGEMPKVRAVLSEEREALRALLAAPWQDSLPRGDGRRASLEPGPDDAYWFGAFGGVDPDQ